MLKLIFCICFIATALSTAMNSALMPATTSPPNLKFANYTGACVT